MYFPSKRDWWLGLILWVGVLYPLVMALTDGKIRPLFISLPAALLVSWFWFGTGYTVTENELKIRSGPIKLAIQLEIIQSIKKSRNPYSSLSLSLDRLEIGYGKHSTTLISPKDQEGFLRAIRERNPDTKIEI